MPQITGPAVKTRTDSLGIQWFQLPELPAIWWTYASRYWTPIVGAPEYTKAFLQLLQQNKVNLEWLQNKAAEGHAPKSLVAQYASGLPAEAQQTLYQGLAQYVAHLLTRQRHQYFALALGLSVANAKPPQANQHVWMASNGAAMPGSEVIDGVLALEPKEERALEGSRERRASERVRVRYVWHFWSVRSGGGAVKGGHYFLEGFPGLAQLEAMPEVAKLWYTRAEQPRGLWRQSIPTNARAPGTPQRGGLL